MWSLIKWLSNGSPMCLRISWLLLAYRAFNRHFPDNKVHGTNLGPIWGRHDPGGPHVGPMSLATWVWMGRISQWYIPVCLHHEIFHIYSRKAVFFFFLLLCNFVMCVNNRIQYGPMVVFVFLYLTQPHYHHYPDVSEGIELIKYLSGIFCWVCV